MGARTIGMDRGAMDRDGRGRDGSRPDEDESRPLPRMSRSAKGNAIHRDGQGRDPPRSDERERAPVARRGAIHRALFLCPAASAPSGPRRSPAPILPRATSRAEMGARWIAMDGGAMNRDGQGRDESRWTGAR